MYGAAATALALSPDRFGAARFPFVALAALRPHVTATALAVAAALAVHPSTRPLAAGVGSAALASAAALGARARRDRRGGGSAAADAPPRRSRAAAPLGSTGAAVTELTVLAANVLVGRADTGALATVLERERPDLVSLPEAGPDYRDKLLPLVAELGYQAWASTAPGTSDGEGVVLLAAARMGALTVTSGREMRHRYLRATGGALGERSFFAVHPEAPMGPTRTAWWESDLAHIARWCAESPGPIVAGDFNATADNTAFRAVLRHGRSAADGTGQGLVGTFPAGVPSWCGIQIDHVLVPAGARTTRFAVLPIAGSDHRAVLAGISLPPG
jgi:endonuclease/exonuclease/phosphatase (EEP) superfamily protein YafD